ncbi:IS1182 family transposase [Exiguobacterium sp. PvP048]|uniref:IS1182 family transposase n=1 Tax=unclassified Exiguobacterium TaxID=2644629 RepID=UPI003397BB60
MMGKRDQHHRSENITITLEQLVPQDHLVRKVDQVMDFEFVYPLVEKLYCENNGRPSINPVLLIKMALLQYLFSIPSMRRTIKEIETNVAYRWFLGIRLDEKVPHFSTFGKNYVRRFQDTDVFETIFYRILSQAVDAGFVDPSVLFMDSTHIKANANKRKFKKKKIVRRAIQQYKEELDLEINEDRVLHGKKPFTPKESRLETREIKESTTDPESGYYVKGERERLFAYSCHTACDRNGFVLGMILTPGNVHDSKMLEPLLESVSHRFGQSSAVVADSAYKTVQLARHLLQRNILPVFPYTRPRGVKGMFKTKDFYYDEYYDCYLCPKNQVLRYQTTTREGYREYVSDSTICASCSFLSECTKSQENKKMILRHIWQEAMDEVEHLRHTPVNRALYQKRQETIERVFADAKEKHGMRWARYRGLKKTTLQAMLTFSALNLKKLANWSWDSGGNPCFSHYFIRLHKTNPHFNVEMRVCLQSEMASVLYRSHLL